MRSIYGTKKAKRRFRDFFKSKDTQLPSNRGPNEDEKDDLDSLNSNSSPSSLHCADLTTSDDGDVATASSTGESVAEDDVEIPPRSQSQADSQGSESTESSTTQSIIKSGLSIGGRFVQTLLKKLPDCVDSNPVKMSLSIIKTIIEIKDEIGDSKDALNEGLQSASLLLGDAIGKIDSEDVEDVKKEIESYKRKIDEQNTQLLQITRELESMLQYFDYENYKKKIMKICKAINETTTMFMLNMQIEIRKTTAKMHEQMKEDQKVRVEEQKERQKLSLRDLNPSRKADHKTVLEGQTLKRETCAEGTRVKILEDITTWANDSSENSPRVFWLTGQAGSGKTTIAYTISKRFEQQKDQSAACLGGNFLCSRQFEETRSLSRIIPTIAYQLAGTCAPYEEALHGRVKDKSVVVDRDISEQMDELLVGPWKNAKFPESQATCLIVIDALDEINEDGGSRLLSTLLTTIDCHDLRGLKFLVTSRTNPDIVKLCETFKSKAVCRLQDVPIEEAEGDVGRYLDIKLPNLVGIPELTELLWQASGLFIYAATAVRILTAPRSITHKEQKRRLEMLLSKPSYLAAVGKEKSPIDGLYQQVLHEAFAHFTDEEDLAPRLRILFTYLCTAERISPSVAAALMDDDDDLARSVLDNLHAVLYVQDDRVFWYHSSFPDFLMEQQRSNFWLGDEQFNFWCNKVGHHSVLASSCFRAMASETSGLKFNMGGIRSSYLLDSECADEISINMEKNISPTLRYACLYWGHHLSSSTLLNPDINRMHAFVSEFLQIRVLFWIEAMNLLQMTNQCALNIHEVRRWVSNAEFSLVTRSALEQDLVECANFATHFVISPAAKSTPHLYISSLATWRSESNLSESWRNQFSSITQLTYGNAVSNVPLFDVDLHASVLGVAFSKDSTQIVAGLRNKTICIIDASTGQVLKVLTGHSGVVLSVSFSDDDKWIASGSADHTIRVWDASTGMCLKSLEGHTQQVVTVAISTNDTLIASGSWDKTIRLWDILKGSMNILQGHDDAVNSISFSTDNTRMVSSGGRTIVIWDVASGKRLFSINAGFITSVVYTHDDAWIVSASHYDRSILVWDATTGDHLATLSGHGASVTSVAVCPPAYILSGSEDESVRIWDATTGDTLKILKGYNEGVLSVACSGDTSRVMSGSRDGSVRVWNLWDVLKRRDNDDAKIVTPPVTSIGFSNDGRHFFFGAQDGSIHFWDLPAHRELRVFKESSGPVTAVVLSESGKRFAWVSMRQIWVWDVIEDVVEMVHKFSGAVRSVAFSQDEKLLVLGRDWLGVQMWDESTHSRWKTVPGKLTTSLSFSENVQRVELWSSNGSEGVWDVPAGHSTAVTSTALSGDASRIVAGLGDNTVRVWDVLTGSELLVLPRHSSWPVFVTFANDNTCVVSGSYDATVRVWDVHTGAELLSLKCRHTRAEHGIVTAVSRDDRFVASGAQDGSVIIWDLEDPPWYLSDTNWIVSSHTDARLMWVPPDAQVIQRPNCRVLVGENLYSSFDFEWAMRATGPTWEKCYTPKPRRPISNDVVR